MKKLTILLAVFALFTQSALAQIPSKNDKEYSNIDFYFDSLYAYQFKQYIEEKNQIDVEGVYSRIDQAIQNASTVRTI
jgi:hypothetical protein